MSTSKDPLAGGISVERPFYQTGVLLDAKDFTDEQSYHRGRLARAMAYLHGAGTVAGLEIQRTPAVPNGQPEELVVQPGLAIDRLGRFIELPRAACIRLAAWFDSQTDQDLNRAYYADAQGVIADVFIRFSACDTGKTPAFGTGAFDALDAFAPARVRDAWRLEIVPRQEHPEPPAPDTPPLPVDPWAAFALRPAGQPAPVATVRQAILHSWREGTQFNTITGELNRLPEHGDSIDPTSVFLARAVIRTEPPDAPGARPARTAGREVEINNEARQFTIPGGLLANWLGL